MRDGLIYRRSLRSALCSLFVCWILAIGPAHAEGDRLWAASCLGSQSAGKSDPRLAEYSAAVNDAFGLPVLRLIAAKKWELVPGERGVLNLKNGYSLEVECLSREAARYHLRIVLSGSQGRLLHAEARLAKKAPIFLCGPDIDGKKSIFIFEVQ